MREIKFQIYWIAGHEMLYDTNNDLEFRDKENYWITDLSDAPNHPERYKVRQYTGLKDKNGTEIYDGDYIRYSTRTINGSIFTHVCRVFQHESGTWRIEGYHEDNHSYETKGTVYAAHLICEVIGSIYENPELAK